VIISGTVARERCGNR